MDLSKQVKFRIDESAFEKLTKLSEENGTTRSRILREMLKFYFTQDCGVSKKDS